MRGSEIFRRLALVVATAVVAGCAVLAPAGAVSPKAHALSLQFLGEARIPAGFTFQGTTVGGLSSITFDADRGVYYALSDDRGEINPSRFYTLRIDVSDGQFDSGDVSVTGVTTLLRPNGTPFPTFSLDPEGLVLTKDRDLVFTSEGDTNRLIDPVIARFGLDGRMRSTLPVPSIFLPTASHATGIRNNLAFESAGVPPDGRFFYTATENALFQDGPAAALGVPSPARLLRYNLQTGRLDREWLYVTDPIAQPPVPAGQFAVNGVVELLPLNNEFLISMERSFSVGVGNVVKLYLVALPGASDVSGLDSLAARIGSLRAAQKTPLLDLSTLGLTLDNLEGITFGPDLPDGRRSLVVISDNNFTPGQFSQVLLFAVSK
jgi:hypothetical protein